MNKRKENVRKSYESRIEDETKITDLMEYKIGINKVIFKNSSNPGYRLARHYFELILSYTASFDEDVFVIIPSSSQLNKWWINETNLDEVTKYPDMIKFIDKLLWDTEFHPSESEIISYELIAKEMAVALQ